MVPTRTCVLVHSPLVGPVTWSQLTPLLEDRKVPVFVPELDDHDLGHPYWKRHSSSVTRQVDEAGIGDGVLLIAHSGAGALLPAIAAACTAQVAGYVFIDAGIPRDGESRLDAMRRESSEFGRQLHEHLRRGGRFPQWTVEMLIDIPSIELRQQVVAQLRPRSLDFFDEPIPVFAGWPDAPGAYLRFTPTYESSAQIAEGYGWPVERIEGGHFEMLADPQGVADALVRLMDAISSV